MVKTKEVTIGDKTLKVREKFSYQILDWAMMEFKKVDGLEANEQEIEALKIRTELLKKMVVDPKIDDQYLADEAGDEEWQYGFVLLNDLKEVMEIRMKELKKKHSSSLESKPEAPERIG